MGCSGSKAVQTSGSAEKEANQNKQTLQNHEQEGDNAKEQDNLETADGEDTAQGPTAVTVEEAAEYIQHELRVGNSRAQKIANQPNLKDEDGMVSKEKLQQIWVGIESKVIQTREMFAVLDLDDSGYITMDEGCGVLKNMCPDLAEEQIQAMLNRFDKDCSGRLSYNEYVFFYAILSIRQEMLLSLLKDGDTENTGKVAADLVVDTLVPLVIETDEAKTFVEDFGVTSEDGEIDLDEFEAIWKKLFP